MFTANGVQVTKVLLHETPFELRYEIQFAVTDLEKDVAKNSVSMNVRRLVDNKLYLKFVFLYIDN